MRCKRRALRKASADEEVFYVDEADIDLNPRIGPAWMPKGEQMTVPTPGKNRKHYLAGALNARTGAVVWTFAPGDLDIINSTPLIDFTNNEVWVTSRAGTGGTQPSFRKLDSNTGAELESFCLGDIDGSSTLNADGKQGYAVTNAGDLVAARTDIPSCTFTTSPVTGAGVGFPIPIAAGANADDIYFSTATTLNKVNLECLCGRHTTQLSEARQQHGCRAGILLFGRH